MKAVIFDLDGTLLNTLDDLADATNYALAQMGYPTRTREEVCQAVGNGVAKLIERSVPKETEKKDIEKTLAIFKKQYALHSKDKTKLYEGVADMLAGLKERGIQMAIVSNKFHGAVLELKKIYFEDYINVALGEQEEKGIRKKPAPDLVNRALELLGCTKEDAVYVGDSDVDIETAKNSGLPCISVTWGFRGEKFLKEHGATQIIDRPKKIFTLL